MANMASPITTYSDTTPQKRAITDFISIIDPHDTAAIDALGGWDGASSKFRFVNTPGKVVEWLEDTLTPLAGSFSTGSAYHDSISSTTTSVIVGDGNMVQVGHILKTLDNELMWVSAKSSASLTVTRAFMGSTANTITSTGAYTIVGLARLEGADSSAMGFTDRTTGSNFTQIFHQEILVSRTQRKIAQYGIADEFDYQAAKAVPSLARLVERQLYYGTASSGSTSLPRTFGGFSSYITTNAIAGTSLVQSMFELAVQSAYEQGGSGSWVAFCGPTMLKKIKNIYDSSVYLKVDRSETTLGMVIERVLTPFGEVDLVLDRWAPSTLIPIVDRKHAGMLTLDPFFQEPLSKDGDSTKGEVIGEFTFCLRNTKAHAILTACS
jgi:hypothetical protein